MILLRKICFKELSELGRNFNWGEHDCEKCQRSMWGHGFVARYFSEFHSVFFLKRYRCPGCRRVATVRPEGYWPRLRSSVQSIYLTLVVRLTTGLWGPGTVRQRAGHWLRRFVQKVRMDWGGTSDLKAALEFCYQKGVSFFA